MEPKYEIKDVDSVSFVFIHSITYIRSDGEYVMIHTDDGKKLRQSDNLSEHYRRIAEQGMHYRIGRFYIINTNKVRRIEKEGYVYFEGKAEHIELNSDRRKQLRFLINAT